MIEITVSPKTLSDIRTLITKLRTLKRRMNNRTQLMTEAKRNQTRVWLRNFDGEGGRYGDWPALSDAALEDRADRGYPPGPILRRSGKLRGIVSRQSYAGQVTRDAVHWDFVNEGGDSGDGGYPLTHHFGMSSGRWNVPARPIWGLNEKDARNLERTAKRWLDAILAEVFG